MDNNAYSRFVNWAKVLLPLAAIMLLSTLFLFSQGRGNIDEIPYAEIEEIVREQRLSNPSFAGVSEDGAEFIVQADVARPDAEVAGKMTVEKILIHLNSVTGQSVVVSGGFAEVDMRNQTVILDRLARIETNTGYKMETTGLIATLDKGHVVSTAPIEIRAPFGELTAGQMTVQTAPEGAQIVFNQGVRLLYQPGNKGTEQ